MKKVLYKCRKSIVFLMRILLYSILMAILFGLLAIHNPQILRASRTAAVTAITFVLCGLFMMQIYGNFDLGKRKSKPIIYSMTLSVIFTDIMTFLMLTIMNMSAVNNNRLSPFFRQDILLMLFGMLWQIVVIIAFTYGGHAFYFSFTDPESCLIIHGETRDLHDLMRGIGKYKKQYQVTGTLDYRTSNLYDEIQRVDIVFLHDVPPQEKSEILAFCYKNLKSAFYTPEITDVFNLHSRLALLDDVSMISAQVKELSFEQRLMKKAMDVVVSAAALIILSPVLLICAIAIKAEDGGSVFFKQNRVTKGGRIFMIYKFRTMTEDAGSERVVDHDARITKVGAVLRKYRLDELPQLFNILKGDMSLVGPRPEMTEHVYEYSEALPEFLYRHRMKAGLTGYAQIMGKYNTSPKDKLVMDLMYIESFSLWNDFKILFQTLLVLLKAEESTEAFAEESDGQGCQSGKEDEKTEGEKTDRP